MEEFLNQIRVGMPIKTLALYFEHFYGSDWELDKIKKTFEGHRGNKTYYKVLKQTSTEFQKRMRNERKILKEQGS